jgi:unsaturated chondroitin disaccharide hydrolase
MNSYFRILSLLPAILFLNMSCLDKTNTLKVTDIMDQSVEKVYLAQQMQEDNKQMPRNILPGNEFWSTQSYTSWTSGFWPGIMWYMYDYTGDEKWRKIADEKSMPVANILTGDKKDHDLGFQFFCSFGNGYRLTKNPSYKEYLLTSAGQLAAMFHPTAGTILSWPHARDRYLAPHNTIIDNLMNLELLFWSAKNGGKAEYYDIALQHATVTMQNQIRPDYTHWHVVAYDTITGKAVQKVTHQGYSDESLWARGQAWGIYGFTMVYRETGEAVFLETAKKMANVFLERLPGDHVPYWDFDAPDIPDAPRDASAAAIAASALLELSGLVKQQEESDKYYSAASDILNSLSENYLSGKDNYAILNHSVGNFNAVSEVDVPIIYADYYFIEALLRKIAIDKQK